MIEAAEFRLVQAQAVMFTPGLQLRTARVLPRLLNAFAAPFDGEPQIIDVPGPGPAELPRITLKSVDERWMLLVAPARVDVFHRAVGNETIPLNEFLDQVLQIFGQSQEAAGARVGRLACVVTRRTLRPDAALQVARHVTVHGQNRIYK